MFIEYITLVSCINFILLAIALLLKKGPNKKSNRILFVLLVFMALYSSLVFLHYTALDSKNYYRQTHYVPIDGMILLAMSPCMYYYILSLLNKPFAIYNPKTLLHLIPFLPYILFNIHFIALPLQSRIDWLARDFSVGATETNWLNTLLYSQIIAYLIVCYRLVGKQLKLSATIQFEAIHFDISWLQTYLIINLSFMVLSLPLCFYFANERANIIIGQLAMDIQFIYMFFKWTLHTDTALAANKPKLTPKKNSTPSNNAVSDLYLQKLLLFLEEEQPYLNEACSIQTVSEQTGIPQYQLTNLLNCKLQKKFPDLINQYRIHTAQQILLSIKPDTTTIESIAAECGFGSKSAFHRAFKKMSNNLTPSEFIRQHKSKG
jgi:AraC-like DNA-binding protein